MNPKSKIGVAQFEGRSFTQIREHYLLEKSLALRLKTSTKEERIDQKLYSELYDELFRKVPHHTQLGRQQNERTDYLIKQRVKLIEHFLKPKTTFLEIGCGTGHLTREVANQVDKIFAIDVSEELTQSLCLPDNVDLVLSDGISVPIPESSIDVAYSHQLMEHLHPDDAIEQLQAIYRALKPNGTYICITPNRLCGPHDISKYFEEVATGFHLKEYSVSELYAIFRQAGFKQINLYKIYRQSQLFKLAITPGIASLFRFSEVLLEQLPPNIRRKVADSPIFFRSITIVGTK